MNGMLVKDGDKTLSPQDRGFRFGDGVFETIPCFSRVLYQWEFHINRLKEAMAALHIAEPKIDWQLQVKQLISKNNIEDGFVRIAVSRGIGSKGYHPLPSTNPTIIIETIPRAETLKSAILWLSSWRKPPLSCLPSNHKTAQGLNSTLALLEADTKGCDEALLLAHDDNLCEAASGNLFWVKDNKLYTPALITGCLNGSTRHALMRLHDVTETSAPLATLQNAEVVFITNCNWGIMPVTKLEPMGWQWAAAHPLTREIQEKYQADIHASI